LQDEAILESNRLFLPPARSILARLWGPHVATGCFRGDVLPKIIFFPGSLSDSNETGQFIIECMNRLGLPTAYVDTQMPISAYVGQLFKTNEAIARNNRVMINAGKGLTDLPAGHYMIIAHSAGAEQALGAIRSAKEQGGLLYKKLKVTLCGPASPGFIDIDNLISWLTKNCPEIIEIERILNKYDFTSYLGCKHGDHGTVVSTNPNAELRANQIAQLIIEASKLHEDITDELAVSAIGMLVEGIKSHPISGYMPAIEERVRSFEERLWEGNHARQPNLYV
jgi:hypothetical protein